MHPNPSSGAARRLSSQSNVNTSGMDRFERAKVLGKGTFGRAWLVREKKNRKEFVAKEIKVETKMDLEEALAEAKVMAQVDHFNIIKYREVMRTSSKMVTIVMEYADDGDLSDKIARRKFRNQTFSEDQILKWFVQACQALDYLHDKGIMHRDIKTANFFLTKQGYVKLGDFGIARVMDKNAERMSARTCKTPVGTPMYMSPELCQGIPYTQKADVWALGCVLYEMCSLRPAFMAQSMEGLVAKIKRGNHNKYMPQSFSPELRALVNNMLHVDPAKRPLIKDILRMPLLKQYVKEAPFTLFKQGSIRRDSSLAPPTKKAYDRGSVPDILIVKDEAKAKAKPETNGGSNFGVNRPHNPTSRAQQIDRRRSAPEGYLGRKNSREKNMGYVMIHGKVGKPSPEPKAAPKSPELPPIPSSPRSVRSNSPPNRGNKLRVSGDQHSHRRSRSQDNGRAGPWEVKDISRRASDSDIPPPKKSADLRDLASWYQGRNAVSQEKLGARPKIGSPLIPRSRSHPRKLTKM